MGVVRVRLLGGALNGQVLWVEEGLVSVKVHVGGDRSVPTTLRYRIVGPVGRFVPESGAAPCGEDVVLGPT